MDMSLECISAAGVWVRVGIPCCSRWWTGSSFWRRTGRVWTCLLLRLLRGNTITDDQYLGFLFVHLYNLNIVWSIMKLRRLTKSDNDWLQPKQWKREPRRSPQLPVSVSLKSKCLLCLIYLRWVKGSNIFCCPSKPCLSIGNSSKLLPRSPPLWSGSRLGSK